MHKPSIITKSLSLILCVSLALGGTACMQDLEPDASELRSGTVLGLNTLEDPLFATPLLVDHYFDAAELGIGNAEFATNPAAVFGRQQVVFGERVWNRVAADEFKLAGTGGEVSIKVASDVSSVVVKAGDQFVRIAIVGTVPERVDQAGFLAVLAMSDVTPSEEVYAAAAAGAWVIGGLLLVGSFVLASKSLDYFWCERLQQTCGEIATRACSAGGGSVVSAEATCAGEAEVGTQQGSTSTSGSCHWVCTSGGGDTGGGSSGGIPTTGEDGENSDDGGEDGGDDGGDDSGNSSDDGGDDGDGGTGDTGGCEDEEQGFSIGAVAVDAGIAVFAGAEDTSEGGETGC